MVWAGCTCEVRRVLDAIIRVDTDSALALLHFTGKLAQFSQLLRLIALRRSRNFTGIRVVKCALLCVQTSLLLVDDVTLMSLEFTGMPHTTTTVADVQSCNCLLVAWVAVTFNLKLLRGTMQG